MELIREETWENEGTRKLTNKLVGPLRKRDIAVIERHDAIESLYNKYSFLHDLFEKAQAYFCLLILINISISFYW